MRMIRSAISPRLAIRILRNGVRFICTFMAARPRTAWLRLARLGLPADRQHLGQHAAGIARIDHAVVEHPRAGREHVHLAVEHADDLRLHRIELFPLDRLAAPDRGGFGDDRHGFGGLLAAHHGGLGVGPGETEARMEAAAAHAVIAGAERRAAIDRDLRHRRRGHRLDHLRAVLDHAGFFIGLADHVAGGVVEIEQRRARLAAGLDEMRRLVGAGNVERAVIGDDADRLALDAGMAADGGGAVIGAEFGEIGIVDKARDRLAHVDRPLVVHRHDAEQFFRIVARRTVRSLRRGFGRSHSRLAMMSRAIRSASRSSSAR